LAADAATNGYAILKPSSLTKIIVTKTWIYSFNIGFSSDQREPRVREMKEAIALLLVVALTGTFLITIALDAPSPAAVPGRTPLADPLELEGPPLYTGLPTSDNDGTSVGCTGDCANCPFTDGDGGCSHGKEDTGCKHEGAGEEHVVEIRGRDMKSLTIREIAVLWGIDPNELLDAIVQRFALQGSYSTENALDDLRAERRFPPADVKTIADSIAWKGPTPDITVEPHNCVGCPYASAGGGCASAQEGSPEPVAPEVKYGGCPIGIVNDPYPGDCGQYVDSDRNGYCDLSEYAI